MVEAHLADAALDPRLYARLVRHGRARYANARWLSVTTTEAFRPGREAHSTSTTEGPRHLSARTGPLTVPEADGNLLWETLGVARVVRDATRNEAEFAIIVRSDLKGHGLGNILMQHLIAYCRTRGIGAIVGESLSDNAALRRLVRRLGFTIDAYGEAGTRGLRLALSGGGGTG